MARQQRRVRLVLGVAARVILDLGVIAIAAALLTLFLRYALPGDQQDEAANLISVVAAVLVWAFVKSRPWRKALSSHWRAVGAGDLLSSASAVVLAFEVALHALDGTSRTAAYTVAALFAGSVAGLFAFLLPKLEALERDFDVDLSDHSEPVTDSQLGSAYVLITMGKPIVRPSNLVALVVCLLGFALAYPGAETWVLPVVALGMVAILSAWERFSAASAPLHVPRLRRR